MKIEGAGLEDFEAGVDLRGRAASSFKKLCQKMLRTYRVIGGAGGLG